MGEVRRSDPCPCGSGKKYKQCCHQKDYIKVTPKTMAAHFTLDNGSKVSKPTTSVDSIPMHNRSGVTPRITPVQMMDLCLDKIHELLRKESVGMVHALVDQVVLEMDMISTFSYRAIAQRMSNDGRFEVIHYQICGLEWTDPLILTADKLKA